MRGYEERTGERMTYALLSEKTGLSRATLESIGSREEYNPTLDVIDKISRALGCELNELLDQGSES
jgi:DNA-binding Xre family transcriptional regulator